MTDERAMRAIRKIEQALGRVEAAADRAKAPVPADDSELLRLRERHRALRDKVAEAIGEIDQLLAAGDY